MTPFDPSLCSSSSRSEPGVEMLVDEAVVGEMRIRGINPGDFLELPAAEGFVRIKAPDAFEQSLAAEDFVQTGGAAGKTIGGVEQCCVCVRDFDTPAKKLRWNSGFSFDHSVAFVEEFHCLASPDSPMTEKAADDAAFDEEAVRPENKGSEQIHYDVVVVTGIQGDVAAGFGDSAYDIEGLVAVERRDFDGDDVFDLRELAPEFVGENAAADGRLQIETNNRQNLRHTAGMSEKLYVARILESGEAQKACVVTKFSEDAGFASSLRCVSADSTDAQERNRTAAISTIHFFSGDFQDGLEEADARLADGELRSVNADG